MRGETICDFSDKIAIALQKNPLGLLIELHILVKNTVYIYDDDIIIIIIIIGKKY